MKRKVCGIAAAVLAVLAVTVIALRVNSDSLALALGGYGKAIVIDEGFSYISDGPGHWRAVLAEKDGANQLVLMEQGFLGFWGLPKAADTLKHEYDGLEYLSVTSVPAYSGFYGYDPYDLGFSMTHTDNWKFAQVHSFRTDWFYHGANAAQTISVPEDALPRDSTLQIYQNGPEYVLHLISYCKGSGSFDGGFPEIYQALSDNGCLE